MALATASRVTAAVLIATTGACNQAEQSPVDVAITPYAESPAPLSSNTNVALATTEVACAIESFEFRVVCSDTAGITVGTFGREGEGPNEFLNPVRVFHQSWGRVTVFDWDLARLTTIEPNGTAVSEVTIVAPFWVSGIHGTDVYGFVGSGPSASGPPEVENQILDITSGEVSWRRSIYQVPNTECGSVGVGLVVPRPNGGFVMGACGAQVLFLDDLNGQAVTVTKSPAYAVEFPNERDVDAYLYDVASLAGPNSMPRSAMEPYATAFREEPKSWFHGPQTFRFDSHERLWVATTRDRDASSYFDVWIGTEYAGIVRIRDRLLGYDILESTLVALVEREPDQDGIAERALDWYEIDGVVFGAGEHR